MNRVSREQFNSEFGRRLHACIENAFRDKTDEMAFRRSLEVGASIQIKPDTFRRWLSGSNVPDAFTIVNLIRELHSHSGYKYDAHFLLTGERLGKGEGSDPSTRLENIQKNTSDIMAVVSDIRSYLRDHEPGLEGVLMRLSIKMLEDLQRTRTSSRTAGNAQSSDGSDVTGQHEELNEPLVAGILPDRLLEIVESCAAQVRLATLRLDYVVNDVELHPRVTDPGEYRDGSTDDWSPSGRLAHVVARNIENGCKYRYLLPGDPADWGPGPSACRRIINEIVDDATVLDDGLRFAFTDFPLGAGFIIFDIKVDALFDRRPSLARQLTDHYTILGNPTDEGDSVVHLGEIVPGSTRTHASMLMDPRRLRMAINAWDRYTAGLQWRTQ